MTKLPPKIFLRFFRWYCHPGLADHIEGDLIEIYRQRLEQRSKRIADLKFMIDVLLLFRPGIIRPREDYQRLNPYDMYKNYLKVALRVFNREKIYGLINVFGLALGFTCCLMIYLFISDELSYDRFHANGSRISRIEAAYMRQGVWEPYATNSWRTAELIKDNYKEVETLVRIMNDDGLVEYGDKRIMESRMAWVDAQFLKVFTFPLVAGNPADALKGPNKVVISESTAVKYFGTADPVGKTLIIQDGVYQLQVSGVMRDMPSNAHFHFDFLISNETLKGVAPPELFSAVGWDSQHVYVTLAPGADPEKMESTFPAFADKNLGFFDSKNFKLFMQPLLSIHLQSNVGLEFEDNGSMYRIYAFSVIAVFILVIACVNYMNLTTARSLRRAKEVGMRKMLGARRGDLLSQFLTESFMITAIALVLALLWTWLLLPKFNQFAGKEIAQSILFSSKVVTNMLGALVVIGLVSGFYPAVILSSFRPVSNLKANGGGRTSGLMLRRGLVVLQFAISIGLVTASAIVFQQWDYLKNKPLGINQAAMISVPLQTMDRGQINVFRHELLTRASVKKIGFSNMRMPGWIGNSTAYRAQDVESDTEVNKSMKIIRVDYDFFSATEASILEGRDFSRSFPADSLSSIIINEAAVAQLRWTNPVGKWMELDGKKYSVVGIVKDFHFESLHREIPPTIFIFSPRALNFAYIRIDAQNIPATLEHTEAVYSKLVTNRDFAYTFLNEDIERQYVGEQKFTEVFTCFTILAIIVACLGTFGLISFTAERKSKEIGIRKVLGASAGQVSFLLIREFMVLLAVASIIAWPLTWYFLSGWMEGFIYRTSIGAGPFILATALAAVIVVLTTGFRAVKAALANPVDALRTE